MVCYKASFCLPMLKVFWRRGIRVPQDRSVITVDDSWLLGQLTPPITSVAVPLDMLGERAATDLIDRIEAGSEFAKAVLVEPETLIVRESTATPLTFGLNVGRGVAAEVPPPPSEPRP